MSRAENHRDDIPEVVDTEVEPFTLVHDILIHWWYILMGALAAAMVTYVVVNMRYVP